MEKFFHICNLQGMSFWFQLKISISGFLGLITAETFGGCFLGSYGPNVMEVFRGSYSSLTKEFYPTFILILQYFSWFYIIFWSRRLSGIVATSIRLEDRLDGQEIFRSWRSSLILVLEDSRRQWYSTLCEQFYSGTNWWHQEGIS